MRVFVYILFLIILLAGRVGASSNNDSESVFTFCAEAPPVTLNSQLATDGATFNASSRTMYNRLVGFEHGTTRVAPSLAKEWQVSADGRAFVFKLRENVHFHTTAYFKPTRTFNADDVLFSFLRMSDKNHPYNAVGGGIYPAFQAQQMSQIIAKIEKVDDMTVRFLLHRPEAPFLANIAMDFASILSAEYGQQLMRENKKGNIDKRPIGTGPFVFESMEKNKKITYKAHDQYFNGRSKIDKLVFLISTDASERYKKLKRNECQLIPDPTPEDIIKIKTDSELKLLQQPGLNITYLAMSVQRQPFSQHSVRKAIYHALNREKYIREVYAGNAQIAKNPIPPTMWSYKKSTKDYDYDINKAKKLLASAGMPNGFETELWYSDVSRPYNPSSKKMAHLIQADLAAVGIKAKLVEKDWQEFLQSARNGEPPLSIQGWTGDNGDPDNFLNNLLSCQSVIAGNNRSRWCHKRFSFLVDRARVTTNIRTRTEYYEEAQQIFHEEIPWVPIAHATVFKAAQKNVEGFRISPFGVVEFHMVKLK